MSKKKFLFAHHVSIVSPKCLQPDDLETFCCVVYVDLFRSRIQPFRECLITYASPTTTTAPDMDLLATELTSIIHSCLDDSVGQKTPRGPGNAWFWTEDLQTLFDRREQARRK
ncbi:hypothetical protein G6F56_013653 [Rhizopus delemar]|nr:hypothetical protein G6F56_013653 [Rhizopus delemar]